MIKYHHMISFIRFNFSKKGILWTKIVSEFSPYVVEYFSKKYPLFIIMIEHEKKTYVKKFNQTIKIYEQSVEQVLKKYELKMENIDYLCDLDKDAKELWNTFYDSQNIKERKNHRLFHHFIPKKLKNSGFLDKEFASLESSQKLTKFL